MRGKIGIAALAIGFCVTGCGTTPPGRDVSVVPVVAPDAAPVVAPVAVDKTADAGKPLGDIQKMMIKRFFAYLESKNPQAKDRLHSLEQRLLALDMQKVMALQAIRYQERKNKIVDDVRKEVEGYVQDPDTLIADLGEDLDKVAGMSAQDLSAARAQLPPIFADLMKAVSEPVTVAEHEDETEDETPEAKPAEAQPPVTKSPVTKSPATKPPAPEPPATQPTTAGGAAPAGKPRS